MGAPLAGTAVLSRSSLWSMDGSVPRYGLRSSFAAFAILAIALVPIALAEGGTPPANTVKPALSGTAKDGQALSTTDGTWSGTVPITFSYQWLRCDPVTWVCPVIAGAQASSYTLTSADVGFKIQSSVTATNVAGQATATQLRQRRRDRRGAGKHGQACPVGDGQGWPGVVDDRRDVDRYRADHVRLSVAALRSRDLGVSGDRRRDGFELHPDAGRRRLQDPVVGYGHERCRTGDGAELRERGRQRLGACEHCQARAIWDRQGRAGADDDGRHVDRHRTDHVVLSVAALRPGDVGVSGDRRRDGLQLHAYRGRRRLQDPVVGDRHELGRTGDDAELRQCCRRFRPAPAPAPSAPSAPAAIRDGQPLGRHERRLLYALRLAAAYDNAKACGSFDSAYAAASLGDLALIKSGSYGNQATFSTNKTGRGLRRLHDRGHAERLCHLPGRDARRRGCVQLCTGSQLHAHR